MPSNRLLAAPAAVFAIAWATVSMAMAATPDGATDESAGRTASAPAAVVTSGLASFYSHHLTGRPTASGAPYDPEALTAAHRSLPLGTQLRVVNPQNDRSVVVTVNDRGPALKKRLIDLSAAAAHALGIKSTGVARVETHVVDSRFAPDFLRPTLAAAAEALSIAPFERH